MSGIDAALAGFAALDAEALGRPWSWRDGRMHVRFALYRTLEDAQEACVRAAAGPHPESRRILALAQRAFGDLRGLLLGLPAALLDRPTDAGEWSIRETLRHAMVVERRYAVQTLWALERRDADPIRVEERRLPAPEQMDVSGGAGAILARLAEARADTHRRLADLAPAAMTRPTVWVHYEVDVRFRLHRFAAHLVEHTVQCEKTLAALGHRPAEGRRIVRRIAAAIGELEGLGAAGEARAVEAALVERLASITGAP